MYVCACLYVFACVCVSSCAHRSLTRLCISHGRQGSAAAAAVHGWVHLQAPSSGFAYDADSEDELLGPGGMAEMAGGLGGGTRHRALHVLWTVCRG